MYFFEVVVSTPALAMSHIMLESYKKYILVSLILHGKVRADRLRHFDWNWQNVWRFLTIPFIAQVIQIPKYASQVIGRLMKPLSHPYHELAEAYSTSSSEEVRNITNKFRDMFIRDINLGLVKQVRFEHGNLSFCFSFLKINLKSTFQLLSGWRILTQKEYPTTYTNIFNVIAGGCCQ